MPKSNIENRESLSKNMRVFLLLGTVIIISITVGLMLKKSSPITQDSIQKEIRGMQNKLPIRIDTFTTLENVEFEKMNIIYSFSVGSDPTQSRELNAADEHFGEVVEASIKQNACLNKNTKRYINSGVSLSYRYSDTNNETIASFKIPAGFCKK